jgi:hypothetical protein
MDLAMSGPSRSPAEQMESGYWQRHASFIFVTTSRPMLGVIHQIPEEVGSSYREFLLAVPTGSIVALRYEVCDVPLDMVLQLTSKFTFSCKNSFYTFIYFHTIHKTLVRKAGI